METSDGICPTLTMLTNQNEGSMKWTLFEKFLMTLLGRDQIKNSVL